MLDQCYLKDTGLESYLNNQIWHDLLEFIII